MDHADPTAPGAKRRDYGRENMLRRAGRHGTAPTSGTQQHALQNRMAPFSGMPSTTPPPCCQAGQTDSQWDGQTEPLSHEPHAWWCAGSRQRARRRRDESRGTVQPHHRRATVGNAGRAIEGRGDGQHGGYIGDGDMATSQPHRAGHAWAMCRNTAGDVNVQLATAKEAFHVMWYVRRG